MQNSSYLKINFNESYDKLIEDKVITPISRYKDCFYLNKDNLFFKEADNFSIYNELIGSKIANYLKINCVNYNLADIIMNDKNIKGTISCDYREKDYELIKLSDILGKYNYNGEINLNIVYDALNNFFNNYTNKEYIINNIMNNLVTELMCDYLIGNNDNGKYNKELLISSNDGKCAPYGDFGIIFNFNYTRFMIKNSDNNDIYNNINDLLEIDEYRDKFISYYERLNPLKLEELIKEVEKDINYKLPDNYKNIIFLSYSRHYERIGEIINKKKKVI